MDQAIIARERLPLIVSVQLGALASVLTWAFYGWMVGVPVVLVSSLAIWGSLNTGFVLDGVGLTMRSLVPGGQRQLPWNQLRGVSLDEVVVGANEGRTTQLRVRFAVDGGESPQLIGCREAVAMEVLTRFQARGLPATDARRDR